MQRLATEIETAALAPPGSLPLPDDNPIGDEEFMISGETTRRHRRLFRPGML